MPHANDKQHHGTEGASHWELVRGGAAEGGAGTRGGAQRVVRGEHMAKWGNVLF